ncbi:hypothetical protein [Vibrio cholerae]|uniref:hypothetical protein n=1 Tax=Vibrio cholerae TaxID=666 RepID=UPI001158B5C7|nr:hypothetical protein [Vibrio cholerae]TQP67205.1 hypothetical protein FLL91_15910 [Vibrio cholerae]TQQ07634.1 hypothetical protein FLL72_07000 [Vibrio cholerae]
MGIFSGVKSVFKKSEAAVVVQNLLAHQASIGLLELDPAKLSNTLVDVVWASKPDIFDGKFGQRPHKIAVAASALANGIEMFEGQNSTRLAIALSLGNVISEIEVNGNLYPFNSLDHRLLETSVAIFSEFAQEPSNADFRNELRGNSKDWEYLSWNDWFLAFKSEAAKINPQLATNEQGSSLIDFMEHEPLKRAYKDRVDPKSLAKDFAEQFDVKSFGR